MRSQSPVPLAGGGSSQQADADLRAEDRGTDDDCVALDVHRAAEGDVLRRRDGDHRGPQPFPLVALEDLDQVGAGSPEHGSSSLLWAVASLFELKNTNPSTIKVPQPVGGGRCSFLFSAF